MPKPGQSKGREANAAQPPSERPGLVSKAAVKRTGEKSRAAAGPDGADAAAPAGSLRKAPRR